MGLTYLGMGVERERSREGETKSIINSMGTRLWRASYAIFKRGLELFREQQRAVEDLQPDGDKFQWQTSTPIQTIFGRQCLCSILIAERESVDKFSRIKAKTGKSLQEIIKRYSRVILDFPGGLVDRTLHFHCRGHWFDPWSGNKRSYMPCSTAKKKKKLQYIFMFCIVWMSYVVEGGFR